MLKRKKGEQNRYIVYFCVFKEYLGNTQCTVVLYVSNAVNHNIQNNFILKIFFVPTLSFKLVWDIIDFVSEWLSQVGDTSATEGSVRAFISLRQRQPTITQYCVPFIPPWNWTPFLSSFCVRFSGFSLSLSLSKQPSR